MDKIEPQGEQATSGSVVAKNVEALRALFPEAFGEGGIKFDVLRQLLTEDGTPADDGEERYGLSWHGKRRARQIALTPSLGTLRPCPDESVDWETTKNIVIEGDNLEVLKLLRKSYAGKVKLIYIDPPYNTGNDFVYPDDFADGVGNYLRITGQVGEDGGKIASNTESSGRFHTNWLNMMYPRLRLSRELLADDGVGFISLDRTEMHSARFALSEIYGDENYLANIVWISNLKGRQISDGGPVGTHEYILCFARNAAAVSQFRGIASELRELMPSLYRSADYEVKHDARGPYVTKNELYNTNSKFNEHTAPTMVFNIHHNPETGETRTTTTDDVTAFEGFVMASPHRNARPEARYHAWRWSREKVVRDAADLEFTVVAGRLRISTKLRDTKGTALKDVILGPSTSNGQDALEALAMARTFDTPKPLDVLKLLVASAGHSTMEGAPETAIILDFFAGSGTTGHAVMAQNAADNGARRYICVQLPEPLDPVNERQTASAHFCDNLGKPRTIAELTKERLRRAGKKVREENKLFHGDTGFRVFKLDTSNLKAWDPRPDDLPRQVDDWIENIRPGRTEQDLLYELLLKLGLDLSVPIETQVIAGKTVRNIGSGTLIVCLDKSIARADAEPLALGLVKWAKQLAPAGGAQFVFRDSAFEDDVAKTNLDAILRQNLPADELAAVRSL